MRVEPRIIPAQDYNTGAVDGLTVPDLGLYHNWQMDRSQKA